MFKAHTIRGLAKAHTAQRAALRQPRPCSPRSLTTTEGRGEATEKAGPGHLAAWCFPVLGEKILRKQSPSLGTSSKTLTITLYVNGKSPRKMLVPKKLVALVRIPEGKLRRKERAVWMTDNCTHLADLAGS